MNISTVFHRCVQRFRGDRRGNVAMILALSLLGLVGTAGLGVDYYNALAAKSRLDLASDAAALAAINAAQAYVAANSSTQSGTTLTNGAIAAGQAQGVKVFNSNAGSVAKSTASTPTVTVSQSGQTFSATVTYQGTSKNSFGPIFGVQKTNVQGSSSSSLTMGKYLSFYLLLDVSGSMGLPATTAGQTQLMAISPDMNNVYPGGCQFACHFATPQCTTNASPNNAVQCQGYSLAQANGIVLRAAAVGTAVQDLLTTAQKTMTITNQYQVGLYPFINQMGTLFAISSNLTNAQTCAGFLGAFLDTGQSPPPAPTSPAGWPGPCTLPWSPSPTPPYDNGGTQFETVLPQMNSIITTVGNGSAASSPQPFVFLVTDGMEDIQYYNASQGGWGGPSSCPDGQSDTATQCVLAMNPSPCTTLKNRGITISVLYIPYQPIADPNSSFSDNEDGKVNNAIPNLPTELQSCASPGFFFSAYTPQDITNALQAMFQQAVQAARLTQ
jgi:Flp pilus assembly protein TadG